MKQFFALDIKKEDFIAYKNDFLSLSKGNFCIYYTFDIDLNELTKSLSEIYEIEFTLASTKDNMYHTIYSNNSIFRIRKNELYEMYRDNFELFSGLIKDYERIIRKMKDHKDMEHYVVKIENGFHLIR